MITFLGRELIYIRHNYFLTFLTSHYTKIIERSFTSTQHKSRDINISTIFLIVNLVPLSKLRNAKPDRSAPSAW